MSDDEQFEQDFLEAMMVDQEMNEMSKILMRNGWLVIPPEDVPKYISIKQPSCEPQETTQTTYPFRSKPMTDKHDYKGALESVNKYGVLLSEETTEAIQSALEKAQKYDKLMERMEGEFLEGNNALNKLGAHTVESLTHGERRMLESKIRKSMAAQLLKEIEDEKG